MNRAKIAALAVLAVVVLYGLWLSPQSTAAVGSLTTVHSTAYGPFEGQVTGSHDNALRPGRDVAMKLPYNTLVYVKHSPTGRHYWRVRDWPDDLTDLDFCVSAYSTADRWGGRPASYRVVK